ncbi:hypothetical protein [Rhizobium sp. BT-175]|nr:hypothetical protein [Rhizobium sp. BT-175]MCV9945056.1 hypothetical protein [Rhizobium sp. BT-175]
MKFPAPMFFIVEGRVTVATPDHPVELAAGAVICRKGDIGDQT